MPSEGGRGQVCASAHLSSSAVPLSHTIEHASHLHARLPAEPSPALFVCRSPAALDAEPPCAGPSADKSTGQPDPAQFPPRRSIPAAVEKNPREGVLLLCSRSPDTLLTRAYARGLLACMAPKKKSLRDGGAARGHMRPVLRRDCEGGASPACRHSRAVSGARRWRPHAVAAQALRIRIGRCSLQALAAHGPVYVRGFVRVCASRRTHWGQGHTGVRSRWRGWSRGEL